MVYSTETWRVRLELQNVWMQVRGAMQRLAPAGDIRPADLSGVFHPREGAAGHPKFEVGPLVFHVPERPSAGTPTLYIVMRGWIIFAPPRQGDERSTTWEFSTEVGYFKLRGDRLVHVYGAHYDMDETLMGHPVFHAHVSSKVNLASAIEAEFHLGPFEVADDELTKLLRNVRTPSAQMDIFSVITQIGADHLVSEASGPEVKEAFLGLRRACDFFLGAGGRIGYLNCDAAARCYRATHWYDREPAAPA